MVVKRLSGDYSCEAFLESSYEKVLRCSSTYGGQYMNDHEIFVASFDYHYALRKLNELGDKDTDREAVLIDIKCKAVDILDKYSVRNQFKYCLSSSDCMMIDVTY